jgi:hypothetical protein
MEQSNYKSIFPLSFEIKKISQKLYEKENIITSMTPEYMQIKTHGTLIFTAFKKGSGRQ